MTVLRIALLAGLLVALGACSSSEPETSFAFDEGPEGWVSGFADYPADADPEFFELDAGWGPLTENLDGSALYSQGHNRSDDLWMCWKRAIEGLDADTEYTVQVTLEVATNIPGGLVGIGGSPGESVFVKVGASTDEPDIVQDDQGWWRMTVDKGNQGSGGDDAVVVGTIANPNLDPETADGLTYELMTLDSTGLDLTATTDGSGKLWVFVGTDSGF